MVTVTLDADETAAVLAGLRLLELALESRDGLPPGIGDVLTDCGTLDMPDAGWISEVCERVNTSEAGPNVSVAIVALESAWQFIAAHFPGNPYLMPPGKGIHEALVALGRRKAEG